MKNNQRVVVRGRKEGRRIKGRQRKREHQEKPLE